MQELDNTAETEKPELDDDGYPFVEIKSTFTTEEIQAFAKNQSDISNRKVTPKHQIQPHPGFPLVRLADGRVMKKAYDTLYNRYKPNLEIEFAKIRFYEQSQKRKWTLEKKKELIFHYKNAFSIISPKMAAGWNRWSDIILELSLSQKLHKVLWGSGNCGKSAVYGLVLYTRWRVNPSERMVVIASKVVKEARTRVFGYIRSIHSAAPKDRRFKMVITDSESERGIFCLMLDTASGKWIKNDRACIVNLPIKVNAKEASIGGNLLGNHPDDMLILGFDESQELPGKMLEMQIFLNWYTNQNIEVHAWGNPQGVDFYNKAEHDLLFRLGAGNLNLPSLRAKEKKANQTDRWISGDTETVRLSMLDSPKDDPDEIGATSKDGKITKQRLHFLAGLDSVKRIAANTPQNSPSWYSQVLGFPFIDSEGSQSVGIITPYTVLHSKEYPLKWKTPIDQLTYIMGVDPSVTGNYDKAAIVVARVGLMMDDRIGIDLMNGEHCRQISKTEGENFIDHTIELMWQLCQELKITLPFIGIETHSVGEVIKYAIQKHIEDREKPKWKMDTRQGLTYEIINPTQAVTLRPMFKKSGHMQPAKEMCADYPTELWTAVRCGIITRQIFNVPDYILSQGYNRNLLYTANGTKYKIESKDSLKERGHKSPNDFDALVNVVEVARRRGKFAFAFRKNYNYQEVYGKEYSAREEQNIINTRMGIIANMLRLGTNMNQVAGRRKGFFSNETV